MTVVRKDWHLPKVPPLGLAYLAASARQAGHEVTVVDGQGEALGSYHDFVRGTYINGLTIAELVDRVDRNVEVIGLSVMFSKQWPLARRLLLALRESFPSTPLIVGGEHITAGVDHVLESSPADFAILGEGEETFVELLDALDRPDEPDVHGIAGLAFRGSLESQRVRLDGDIELRPFEGTGRSPIVRNVPRTRQRDLDSIPWPAWDLFPVRKYIDTNQFQDISDRRVMIMLGTRGCPYRCRFCSNPQMWSTNFYMRDPKDIVDEIEQHKREYGTTEFQFQDLTFVINRRWVLRVAEEIIGRGLDITWKLPGGTRSEAFDAELFARLGESGCRSLTLAPESGSRRVLADMQKESDPDRFIELGRIVRRHRIDVDLTFFIIVGSPSETWSDLLQTYGFIARLALAGYNSMLCSRFTCYPGSAYHEEYVRRGLIRCDDDYFLDLDLSVAKLGSGRSWHPRWSGRRIRAAILVAYLVFFSVYYVSRPMRMFRSVIAVLKDKPKTRIELVFARGFAERFRWIRSRLSDRRTTANV